MMKFLQILLVFILSTFSLIGQETLMLKADQSYVKYDAKHVLHAWEGINENIKGVIVKDQVIEKIAIAAQVVDFDSGNAGRDAHSLEVLEALKFPTIKFYSEKIKTQGDVLILDGEVEFHGQKKSILVYSTLIDDDDSIVINGKFRLIPSEFLIELPSFMLVKMEDFLNIQFELKF